MRPHDLRAPVVVGLLALALGTGCGDDPKEPVPEPGPTGRLVDATGCTNVDTRPSPPTLQEDRGFLFWSFDADTGLLRVRHVNAGLNCCPEYTAGITIADTLLTITETETEGLCRCLCLYDFTFEISNLPVGRYRVTVEEEYLEAGDEPLEGVIDLTQAEFGTIQAIRGHYPWDPAR